jgi:four helix bundle protein
MLTLSHKKLEVYTISLNLIKEVYFITSHFPAEEKFGLTTQIKRAAVSISCNIAEGAGRISKQEKKRFFEIARSSCVEVDTQLEIAIMLNYIEINEIESLNKIIHT